MADLIVIVFWHAHALDIPFPIVYRREHLGELGESKVTFLDYAHTILDCFFADTKTIIPDMASVDR